MMEGGEAASVTLLTLDLERRTGGEFRRYENPIMHSVSKSSSPDVGNSPQGNLTRLLELPDGSKKAVHIRLILQVNDEDVIW